MSTRTTLRPTLVLSGSMAGDLTSTPTILQSLTRASYMIKWSGTSPVGTVSIEGSNDYALDPNGINVANSGTWTALTVSYNGTNVTTVPVSGNTGSGMIDIATGIYAVRLIYTAGSGTGTLSSIIMGKVN